MSSRLTLAIFALLSFACIAATVSGPGRVRRIVPETAASAWPIYPENLLWDVRYDSAADWSNGILRNYSTMANATNFVQTVSGRRGTYTNDGWATGIYFDGSDDDYLWGSNVWRMGSFSNATFVGWYQGPTNAGSPWVLYTSAGGGNGYVGQRYQGGQRTIMYINGTEYGAGQAGEFAMPTTNAPYMFAMLYDLSTGTAKCQQVYMYGVTQRWSTITTFAATPGFTNNSVLTYRGIGGWDGVAYWDKGTYYRSFLYNRLLTSNDLVTILNHGMAK